MYDENIGVLYVFTGGVRSEATEGQTSYVVSCQSSHWREGGREGGKGGREGGREASGMKGKEGE